MDQKARFYGRNQWAKRRKDNRIIVSYGAGDGNRTHGYAELRYWFSWG